MLLVGNHDVDGSLWTAVQSGSTKWKEFVFNPSKRAIVATEADGKTTVSVHYPTDQAMTQFEDHAPHEEPRNFDSKGTGGFSWDVGDRLVPADPPADRVLDLPDEPDAGRRVQGDELRQVAREADGAGLAT